MVVSLYTARVVLNSLGTSDYGLYNVVGGIITILSVLTVLVSSGTQRFLNFEMGKNASVLRLREIFTASLTVYLAIYGVIFLLGETIGLWFVNTQLVVPEDRMDAVNFVYQVTIFQLLLSFIQSPYTSAILAHERMNVYGYVGIGEPLFRLILISLLPFCGFDKMIAYSLIVLIMGFSVTTIYVYFCRKNFEECRFQISRNIPQIKEMLSFTVWNLLESLSNALSGQGLNILLNIFFDPIVNAARAVAFQVNNAVRAFAVNFLVAVFPQITKNYAAGNTKDYYDLMIRGGKFAFIVLSILMIPIMINVEYILTLWLKTPPENAAMFVILVLVAELIRMTSETLYTGIQATGNIKSYQIVTNAVTLLNLPLCYVLLSIWKEPAIVFYTTIFVSLFFVVSRMYFISKLTNFPSKGYAFTLIFRCLIPFALAYIPMSMLNCFFEKKLWSLLSISTITVLWSGFIFMILSMTKNERNFIVKIIKRRNF